MSIVVYGRIEKCKTGCIFKSVNTPEHFCFALSRCPVLGRAESAGRAARCDSWGQNSFPVKPAPGRRSLLGEGRSRGQAAGGHLRSWRQDAAPGVPRLLPRGRRSGDVAAQVAPGRWGGRVKRPAHFAFVLGNGDLDPAGEVAPRGVDSVPGTGVRAVAQPFGSLRLCLGTQRWVE